MEYCKQHLHYRILIVLILHVPFYQTFVVGILNYLRKLRETNLNSEKLLVVTVLVGVLFSTEAASERRKHSRERGGGAGLGL